MDCTEIQEQLHGSEEVYADVPLPGRFKPVFHSRISKGQTEDENFQRLDRQNKFLQRRMNVKKLFLCQNFSPAAAKYVSGKRAYSRFTIGTT